MKTAKELHKLVDDLKAWRQGPGATAISNAIDAFEEMFRDPKHQKLHAEADYAAQSVRNPNAPDTTQPHGWTPPPPVQRPIDKMNPENNNPDTRQADPAAAKPAEGGTPSNPRLSEPEKPKVPDNTPESLVHGKINTTKSMSKNG